MDLAEVRRQLNVEEPDYRALARSLGIEAAPHLRALVAGGNQFVAAKAAYLASLLPGQAETVTLAARSAHPVVRLAAADAAANLTEQERVEPLQNLLDDADAGVRKTAVLTASRLRAGALRRKVQHLERTDPEAAVRTTAQKALSHWPE
jgi:HEAT repeat protein